MIMPVEQAGISPIDGLNQEPREKNVFIRIADSNRVSELFDQAKENEKKLDELAGWDKVKRTAKIWAKIFDSRASTYRGVMDLIGADIPTVIAGMRNISSFIEQSIEAAESFIRT